MDVHGMASAKERHRNVQKDGFFLADVFPLPVLDFQRDDPCLEK